MVTGVMVCCRDKFLWRYIEAEHTHVIHPTEVNRRWGMTCPCPEHIQMRLDGAQHITRKLNSRKLPEAYQYCKDELGHSKTAAASLTEAQCEGDQGLWGCRRDPIRTRFHVERQGPHDRGSPPSCPPLRRSVAPSLDCAFASGPTPAPAGSW